MSGTRRLELHATIADGRLSGLTAAFPGVRFTIADVATFTEPLDRALTTRLIDLVSHPLRHRVWTDGQPLSGLPTFDTALEIGFLPGVTDNAATTLRALLDAIGAPPTIRVHTSRLHLLEGADAATIAAICDSLANPLIHRVHVKSAPVFQADGGMDVIVPAVRAMATPPIPVPLNGLDDVALAAIGKKGVPEAGQHRGPLGLDLASMRAIRDHFAGLGRAASDIEIETLAQTWSEHCKHTIFAAPIDDLPEGLYRGYIKRATQEVRAARGNADICVSVFSDNAGGIVFDDDWLVCDKVETHNTPSALDPFGGAITGVLGVNRDVLCFGKGARPILNRYGFCLPMPGDDSRYFRDPDRRQAMPNAHQLTDGVIRGIEQGGNHSGIPSPRGFVFFHPRYRGKPLVFAGSVGLIPRRIAGALSHEKAARPGDRIVMAGGRIGKDGIHGATFSSEALDEGSPSTAVQIGDPITQKRLIDAVLREARDRGLYTAITDNGAGGLSSSVGEMARDAGGFEVDLDTVPLKYPGLSAWEIWISESQERITLAVPPDTVADLIATFARHGAEATEIGVFTDSGRAVVRHRGRLVMDLSMEFLHNGNPVPQLETWPPAPVAATPVPSPEEMPGTALPRLLASANLRTREAIAVRYDHEVQAASLLKPLQGKGRVFADAAAVRPVATSDRAVIVTEALHPRLSELDAHRMAHWTIAQAAAQAVAAGAPPDHLALLDNFCWCSSDQPERLFQLKEAARGCYEAAVALGLPFISGKDSMFNDFRGFDAAGRPVTISAPPTLLISALAVAPDWRRVISLDAKAPGDCLFVLGATGAELGGSAWHALHGTEGHQAPPTDLATTRLLLEALHGAIRAGLVNAAVAAGHGGLAVAAARMAIAGQLGLTLDLARIPCSEPLHMDSVLYAETAGRILVAVPNARAAAFMVRLQGLPVALAGTVTREPLVAFTTGGTPLARHAVAALTAAYRTPLGMAEEAA